MEWVETTAKTLEEAKDLALDRLGVAADEAEFEVLEEPRAGLFGRLRGEARVRARVMPTAVRPKQDRRGRGRKPRDGQGTDGPGKGKAGSGRQRGADRSGDVGADSSDSGSSDDEQADMEASEESAGSPATASSGSRRSKQQSTPSRQSRSKQDKEHQVNTHDAEAADVSPAEVGAAADTFMTGLVAAFGATGEIAVDIDGSDIEVQVSGGDLGLLVGHGGRTLIAVQDLARVASQRRLGDHETRLRIDVGGYRKKRAEALSRFALTVADQVVETGMPKALEPMQSADRKVVHDALAVVDGVTSRSEGDDPVRRVVISPA